MSSQPSPNPNTHANRWALFRTAILCEILRLEAIFKARVDETQYYDPPSSPSSWSTATEPPLQYVKFYVGGHWSMRGVHLPDDLLALLGHVYRRGCPEGEGWADANWLMRW